MIKRYSDLSVEEADALIEVRELVDVYETETAMILKNLERRSLVEIGEPKKGTAYWGDRVPHFAAKATHKGLALAEERVIRNVHQKLEEQWGFEMIR